jgi:uncharacterized protein
MGLHYVAPFFIGESLMNRIGPALLAFALSSVTIHAGAQAVGRDAAQKSAQAASQTSGTLVIVPAYAEVKQPNDEARIVFMIEEQDRDKAAAASRVNQKMKQGADIIRREDPQAVLQTRGYYTYPVYPEDQPPPRPAVAKPRQPTGWRVGQYLEATTANIAVLPKTVAAAQRILALNGLQFSLSEEANKKLDAKRIEATYRNLTERIVSIARAMGRNPNDAILETVDFEATGAYAEQDRAMPKGASMRMASVAEAQPVEEPSFEPGETALQMRVIGKVRFR